MEFRKRTDIHWARKMWHMGGVSLLAATYSQLSTSTATLLILGGWLLCVPIDFLRLKKPRLNIILTRWFKPIMREHERQRLAGTSYLLTGVGLVVAIFPREVVTLTLLFLAFADPMASFIGIRFGRDKIFGHKSLQGSLAAFLVCTVATFLYLSSRGLLLDRIIVVSLFGGLIGCLAELIPVGKIDDNFTLPVLSSIFLWLLLFVFGVHMDLSSLPTTSGLWK